jgi:hypothetical protein
VAIGDKQFAIQPQDLVFAPADKHNWYGGVQSRGKLAFDIFGDSFLKSVYAVSPLEAEISGSMLMKDRFGTKATNDLESFQKLKKPRIWTLRLSHRGVHSLLCQEGFVSMGGALIWIMLTPEFLSAILFGDIHNISTVNYSSSP